MGISLPPDTAKARISRNVDKMASQGASDAEIEEYIQSEGLKPVQHADAGGDVDLRKGIGDLRNKVESTNVNPRKASPATGGTEGVLDAGLNQLTFGLHQKGLGAAGALVDMLTHGTNAHPIDTYKASTEGTRQRIAAANQEHPLATKAAEATGFFAPLALEAPLRALVGAKDAIQGTQAAGGIKGSLQRIGRNTAIGGAAGAGITGIASDSPIEDRPKQMAVGGVLGSLLGGGATAASEGVSGLVAGGKKLFRSAEAKGGDVARQQIVARLKSGNLSPEVLLDNAKLAQETGAPAVAAHLGGPALDDLSYMGASSMSPSGAAFKGSLEAAQHGERDVLQRGITEMSGIENTPENRTAPFLANIEAQRKAAGKVGYPKAYAGPPITDPDILAAIDRDPDLAAALTSGQGVLRRKMEADALAGGVGGSGLPTLSDLPAHLQNDPKLVALLRQQGKLAQEGVSEGIPVQEIDYMKRGMKKNIQRGLKAGDLAAEDAGAMSSKLRSVLEAADQSSPEYGKVRAEQQGFFQQRDAGKAGANALRLSPEEIAMQRGDLPSSQADRAYQTTSTSSLRNLLDKKKTGANLSESVFGTPNRRSQLSALFGEDASKIDPYLEQGSTLNRVLKAATGGSQTEPRMAVRAAVKDAAGTDLGATLASRRPLVAKIEKILTNGHSERVQRAISETLARELNVPADSPELAQLVDRLYRAIPFERAAPNPIFDASRGAGIGFLTRLGVAGGTAVGGRP